ncbi:MAG: hypothetical protein GF317_06950 [Candidatus Lokiarchaeota archaeon]|nr:hypothetical protein [Candidatus Lokiarchaeota archaeon]MBD3199447.1 hypothetical protein [Candidatus Lokiarchaeota archaeon]
MKEEKFNSLQKKLIILIVFLSIIVITAYLDWVAEHPTVGLALRYFWLVFLLNLGLVIPLAFMLLAGNETKIQIETDKKLFLLSVILFIVANGIPIIFYVILGIPPGFFLYIQLALFGLLPAYFPALRNIKYRLTLIFALFAFIILPIGIMVDFAISDIWLGATDKTFYYLSFWGLLMTFYYLIIAIGWKLGGGSKRQTWNIFIAGTLLQYSTLEDFLYFILNGQPLPGTWPWMSNFVINLEWLFGRIPTDLDLLLFCTIITTIALFILFDIHGYIYKRIKID